ncbi:hypothetical protein [Cellulomonas gelida]|uniref:Uncharacterized protein n=1 Tax=Cellulomonas gelida TaxID=1712 RepID=A0A4Y3KK68_9CELL|nr:hypothetical protein [Cellulomonas gelida]GEA83358.1 hypothetical protein CGE01nite_06090 [Cellulomonas gelida]GGL13852.1 hypothetical protein GCM10009774_00710 [Cellulomonas gelida]
MTHEHDDQHEHDDHGHDSASHGSAPLTAVDPAGLHAAVDALAATLHAYVDTAIGVRAEFGSSEADEDPRILALEARVGTLNAGLYDAIHDRLGMHSDLTGMTWQDDDEDDEDTLGDDEESDAFHVGLVVVRTPAAGDRTLDSALDVVEAGAADITQTLVEAGFSVVEWGVARGAHVVLGDEDDDEDDE